MTPNPAPRLAPPGAGLPKAELFVARWLFAFDRWRCTRESFDATFARQRVSIRDLYKRCDRESGARRVLIRRVRGIEDSSRDWSVWMTLDHLRIVNAGFTAVVRALTHGVVPPGKASTAAVKPSPDATAEVVPLYEAACDAWLAAVAPPADLRTPTRFTHPWFGSLDAAGWHALAGTHMSVHRVQLQRILTG